MAPWEKWNKQHTTHTRDAYLCHVNALYGYNLTSRDIATSANSAIGSTSKKLRDFVIWIDLPYHLPVGRLLQELVIDAIAQGKMPRGFKRHNSTSYHRDVDAYQPSVHAVFRQGRRLPAAHNAHVILLRGGFACTPASGHHGRWQRRPVFGQLRRSGRGVHQSATASTASGPIHQFHLPAVLCSTLLPYGFLENTGFWYISEHLYQFGTLIMTTCHGLRRGKIPSQVPGFERG